MVLERLVRVMTYKEYMNLLTKLFAEGKTTGPNQSDDLLNYAGLNLQRMNRLNKKVELTEELKSELDNLNREVDITIITEGWCGDAAQNLPLFSKIEEYSKKVSLNLVLRDENLDLMDQYLTNGGRSIPKAIIYDRVTKEELGTWGPRPDSAQQMVMNFKKIPDGDYSEFVKQLQLWYAKDKTLSQQKEITAAVKNWNRQQ